MNEWGHRQYVLLRDGGGVAGFARMEHQGETARVCIRVNRLPQQPVRGLALAGRDAVTDLGLVKDGSLHWEGSWQRGWHTLALVTDWPQVDMVLQGEIQPCYGRKLGSVLAAARKYLRYPAAGSAACPFPLPETTLQRSVFMLRPLTTGDKGLQ